MDMFAQNFIADAVAATADDAGSDVWAASKQKWGHR